MKNFYFYLAGLALLASGAEKFSKMSGNGPSIEVAAQKKAPPAQKRATRIPFVRSHGKSKSNKLLAPSISATNTAAVTNDIGLAGASAGDELEYTVTISNGGPDPANGTTFSETLDINTTLVANSLKVSPIAVNDSYSTIGNVGINIATAQGLFANDVSPGGTALSLNSSTTVTTANGGTATITASTGAFTYEPAAGYIGSDSFTYEIQNGSGMTATATVTIAVGSAIWFIDDDAALGGTGTLAKPFKTLGAFQAINDGGANRPKDGHFIFIYSGSYDGGITVRNGQKVFGQGATQSLLTLTGLAAPSGSNLLPGTGGIRPALVNTGGNVFTLSGTATVQGLNIGNSSGDKFFSSAGGVFTASEINLTGTGVALNISGKQLAATFGEVSSSVSSGTSPIRLSTVTGNLTITSGTLTAINTPALDISGGIVLAVNLNAVNANGGSKGLIISGTSGTFQVAGSGTTAGSGGTIQNITQRGIELLNTAGITLKNMNLLNANQNDGTQASGSATDMNNLGANAAVYALNTNGLTMDRVAISGTVAQEGINLRGSSNFNFTNGSIGKSGSQSNLFEGCIFAVNTGGTNTIVNSTMTDPGGRVAYFANFSTNMTSLTVDNSTFQDADGASGLQFVGYGNSNMKVRVQGSSKFLNCRTVGAEVLANENSVMTADIKNSTVDPGTGVGRGFDVAGFGNSTLKFNIESNSVKHYGGIGINSFAFANAFIEGTIKNNTTENLPGSNAVSGIVSSSEAVIAGANTARAIVLIEGNNVKNASNIHGISTQVNNTGSARSDFTFINNIVEVVGSSTFWYGIDVTAPDMAGNNAKICTNVRGNAITIPGTRRVYRARAGASTSQVLSQGAGTSVQSVWSAGGNTPAGTDAAPRTLQSGNGTFTFTTALTAVTCQLPGAISFREGIAEALEEKEKIAEPVIAAVEEEGREEPEMAVADTVVSFDINKPTDIVASSSARTEAALAGETVVVNGTGSGFTLPAGKSTTIKFRATINSNIPTAVCQVSTQGSVSGSNFTPAIQTDDPAVTGASNPTLTTVTSVPVITFCPGNITVNPDAGTCTATRTFTATADACPVATLTYTVAGNPITFPYIFPAGATTVTVTAANGIGTAPTCSFTVTVTPIPAPVVTQNPAVQTICAGGTASFTVAGTGTISTYQWQKKPFGGAFSNISSASNASAATATLSLTNVPVTDNKSEYQCIIANPCASVTSPAATLNVNMITASSIAGTVSVNQAAPNPTITFGATGGTLPYTFSYRINNGAIQTLSTTGVATTASLTQTTAVVGVFSYELSMVTDALGCILKPATVQRADVTVVNNLTASISAGTSVCVGATAPQVIFTAVNGIAPFTFVYKLNGGPNVTLSTTGSNTTASVTVPTTAPGTFSYELTSVSGAGGGGSQPTGQTASVVVNEVPTIVLSGEQYECNSALDGYTVFFTATTGSIVTCDKGTVTGNTVTGIPSGQSALLTVTKNGCSSTLSVSRNCALPVTLVNFSAAKQENSVLVKWQTTAETNSEKFDIERSADAKTWQTIGMEKSGGESSAVLNYSFADAEPASGDNFYRLKMVDKDQTYAYSRIVYVKMDANSKLEIYPNPVSDILYLKTSDWAQIESVELYNLGGSLVYKSDKSLSKSIEVSNLPVGLYVLSIFGKDGKTRSQKVVISR